MAVELLFSRNRTNHDPVRFTDFETSSSEVMVDVLSIMSRFRRTAGWVYPLRPVSDLDYERGRGSLLLFGKNNVKLDSWEGDSSFEFFPRFGVKDYIISFYRYLPPEPPPRVYYPIGQTGREVSFSADDASVFVRSAGQTEVQSYLGRGNLVVISGDTLFFESSDDGLFYALLPTGPFVVASVVEWADALNDPNRVVVDPS